MATKNQSKLSAYIPANQWKANHQKNGGAFNVLYLHIIVFFFKYFRTIGKVAFTFINVLYGFHHHQ